MAAPTEALWQSVYKWARTDVGSIITLCVCMLYLSVSQPKLCGTLVCHKENLGVPYEILKIAPSTLPKHPLLLPH